MAIDRKKIIKELNKATPKGCIWYITIKGENNQYDTNEYSIQNFFWGKITWRDETAHQKYCEDCGVEAVTNKYGDIVLNTRKPFNGEAPFPTETRFYPSYSCKAIPIGISNPQFLESAPEDLFKGIIRDWDKILERCQNSEPTETISHKKVKLYDIDERIE